MAGATQSERQLAFPSTGDVLAVKYRMEAVLGVGGMALVVAARHIELDERFALKILLPKYRRDEEIVARFRREARAAAKVRSDHVARVHDVTTLDDGTPCLVMEFLEGIDLESKLLDTGALDPTIATDYILQACEALAEAHGVGIVHRDLKPANLFLCHRTDGRPWIKVLDFGISKLVGRGMTRKSVAIGTPHYMSPEQLRGASDVDQRSDIWALGAILYELVCGKPPFDTDDIHELQRLVFKQDPPPLAVARRDVPAGLVAITNQCLAKDRNARFPGVVELARALAPYGSPGAVHFAERVARVAENARERERPVDPSHPLGLTTPAAAFLPTEPPSAPTRTSITVDNLDEGSRTPTSLRVIGLALLVGFAAAIAIVGTQPLLARMSENRDAAESAQGASGIESVPGPVGAGAERPIEPSPALLAAHHEPPPELDDAGTTKPKLKRIVRSKRGPVRTAPSRPKSVKPSVHVFDDRK